MVARQFDEGPIWDAFIRWEAWAESGLGKPTESDRDYMRGVLVVLLAELEDESPAHDTARAWALLLDPKEGSERRHAV